jgi:hypothetical protein
MIHQQLNKRLLGKPYIKYGQCPFIWAYLFELGGILAIKHRTQLDAFGLAFLGGQGESGLLKSVSMDHAHDIVGQGRATESMTFADYVQAEYLRASHYTGDASGFFSKHGMDRMQPEPVAEVACRFAFDGVAVGVTHPDLVKTMFHQTYFSHTREQWQKWHAAGLDIGAYRPSKTYEEAEEEEDKAFLTYCRDSRPQIYSILNA